MGAALGAQLVAAGVRCLWLPGGRGPASSKRAEAAGLEAAKNWAYLAESCSTILSVCPPAAALDIAEAAAETGFSGVYVEANAISPQRAQDIAALLDDQGATVVDGGIVGPPPHGQGTTQLHLSGPDHAVQQVHDLFAGTGLRPVVMSGPVGRASALKLAFATYNKISQVLAVQACALADGHGVLDELTELAAHALPGTPLEAPDGLAALGARAWRWEPEMDEISDACAAAGVPTDLAEAAADLLGHWRRHKGESAVTLAQLLADLRR
jgi:3-hydroxyisobutyrate dehydrogenase-like beta-hydroxyacid dehydrogenase